MGEVLPFSRAFLQEDILPVLPGTIGRLISSIGEGNLRMVEEIRVREGRPLILGLNHGDSFVTPRGTLSAVPDEAYLVTADDTAKTLHLISSSSFYALEEELKKGFLTLRGGHRVGLTGRVVLQDGQVRTMKDISGFNFRIAREVKGAADKLLPHLIDEKTGEFYHTLIISPPCCGKTTLLRDIVRQLSEGIPKLAFRGVTVGLVDERSEIAGCNEGRPQLAVGYRTDVLDACPKAEGIMMLIRSMGPAVIASDEIGREEDSRALLEALNAGIKVITTAHGKDLAELVKRPNLHSLFNSRIFERYVILGRSQGVGTIEKILGSGGEPVNQR